jgi:hypothetical protein
MGVEPNERENERRSLAQGARSKRGGKRGCLELLRRLELGLEGLAPERLSRSAEHSLKPVLPGACAEGQFSAMKKYSAGCIFLLHAGTNLVFCECELT